MGASGNYVNEANISNWKVLTVNYASKTTIAFVATGDTITDSASGFVSEGFTAGMRICLSGSTSNDSNNYIISSVVAGIITLDTTNGDSITLDEVAGDTVTITSGERQETIERMEDFIENITEDYFYAKAFVLYFNGNNKDQLFLNQTPDIVTVTEILVAGEELDTAWWTYDSESVYLDPEVATGGTGTAELLLRMNRQENLFPKGLRNIKITGTYGKSTVPPAIKQAVIMLCMHENDETLYSGYDDIKIDKLGDASIERFPNQKYVTGIHEVDRLLKAYTKKKVSMWIG